MFHAFRNSGITSMQAVHLRTMDSITPCAVDCQIVKERKMAEVVAPSPRKHAQANKSDKASSRSERKPSAAERIGIGRPR